MKEDLEQTVDEALVRKVRGGLRLWTALALVGLPAVGRRLDLDPGQFVRREKWLTGTMYGSEDPAVALPVLLEHVRAGRLELASLVGPTYPLDRVDEAIEDALAGTPGRVLVLP